MHCAHCGAQVMPGQMFCNKCGQPVSTTVPGATPASALPQPLPGPTTPPAQPSPGTGFAPSSRVARHLSVLGILWIVLSAMRLIPGLAVLALGHLRFPFMLVPIPENVRSFLTPFLAAIGLMVSAFAVAGVIAGWGLIARCPWARMLAIVLGCIGLIHFPLGTALGIYTLWVLIPAGADTEYQRLARAN